MSFSRSSVIQFPSVVALFKNFLRAGVLKKRSRTITVVPSGTPASSKERFFPPFITYLYPKSDVAVLVISSTFDTAATEARASPRNPSDEMLIRSSALFILLVACRIKALGILS